MNRQPIHQISGTEFFSITNVPMSVFRILAEDDPRHTHDFCELVLVSEGTAQHELFAPKSETPATSSLNQGGLFFIPLGWSHRYRKTDRLEIFNVLFAPQLVELSSKSTALLSSGKGAFDVPAMWSLQRSEYEHLATLLQAIMRELTGRQRGFDLAAQAKLVEALVWVDRLSLPHFEKHTAELHLAVSKAVNFMERHFTDPILLADIARTAHLSTHYFSEIFKDVTGLSPRRYLLRLRLEHARYLLLTTSKPVSLVAREVGFTDASYFARAFKAAFGTAPTRLRRTGRQS